MIDFNRIDLTSPEWIITIVFVGLMLLTWLVFEFSKGKRSRHAALLPNLLTIEGILGTFVGITYGLLRFDVADLDASIPGLLAGLRAAFLTSIVGISAAVILRYRNHRRAIHIGEETEGATLDTLAGHLQDLRKESIEANDRLVEAVSGDEAGTLLGQIKLMRGDQKDDNAKLLESMGGLRTELVSEFRAFAETMAEQNTDALIEALSEVIRDFNVKLSEQFGENFKQLNEGVARLVDWQENYRAILEETSVRLQETAAATRTSADAIETIRQDFQHVTETSTELGIILAAYAEHNTLLREGMQRFADATVSFETRLPRLEDSVKTLTERFSEAVLDGVRVVNEAAEAQRKAVAAVVAQSEQLTETVSEVNRRTAAHVENTFATTSQLFERMSEETTKAVNQVLTETVGAFSASVRDLVQAHLSDIQTAHNNVSRTLNDNVQTLDHELGLALNKSLETLGSQLAALSGRFVQDYQPLTDRLRDVVRMSEQLDA